MDKETKRFPTVAYESYANIRDTDEKAKLIDELKAQVKRDAIITRSFDCKLYIKEDLFGGYVVGEIVTNFFERFDEDSFDDAAATYYSLLKNFGGKDILAERIAANK